MNLINTTEMPPKGYQYFEPALNWRTPPDLALQGLRMVAEALQQVRAHNPQAGLDPSYQACVEAIGAYTCTRLAGTKQLAYFCGGTPTTDQERAQMEAAQREASRPKGCAGCGGRR
jgi:hypothetical protein